MHADCPARVSAAHAVEFARRRQPSRRRISIELRDPQRAGIAAVRAVREELCPRRTLALERHEPPVVLGVVTVEVSQMRLAKPPPAPHVVTEPQPALGRRSARLAERRAQEADYLDICLRTSPRCSRSREVSSTRRLSSDSSVSNWKSERIAWICSHSRSDSLCRSAMRRVDVKR